ncbi:MAG: ribosomal L7Ae/L30e/S12e/Gadd45 family protein [Oscillospiraceae bacterium]|nr:ribosomal L7Ae/L30e/S12e/Gadd45 family protein [Oscillospiraceae bacterium]MDD4367504.1 ribosomal L7Ae/L30e/S12e/Gadd45 family protein [Oscillospiraceae bacterium]
MTTTNPFEAVTDPQQRRKILGLLGLAYRAGQLLTGSDAVEKAIRKGQVCLVILAEDCSPNTLRQVLKLAATAGISGCCCGSKADYARFGHGKPRAVLALTDPAFAKGIRGYLA